MNSANRIGSELKQALLAFRNAFVTVGAFSLIINLLMLVPAIYMLQVYDRALGSRNVTTSARRRSAAVPRAKGH